MFKYKHIEYNETMKRGDTMKQILDIIKALAVLLLILVVSSVGAHLAGILIIAGALAAPVIWIYKAIKNEVNK